ncbi:MAG: ARMT1-like domain-containing protein [Paludibacter sp.]|nr:ARMT1-like domain-containing protein [Paludibacter sp.]
MAVRVEELKKYTVDRRCIDCQFRSFERLMNKFRISSDDRQKFSRFYNDTMSRSAHLQTPQIHRLLNDEFCRLAGSSDLYVEEKHQSNATALRIINELRPEVEQSTNLFNLALKLSIAGNIMDYGASGDFDIHATIQKVLTTNFAIDHSKELENRMKLAKNILYLGDNAGEIVFDKFFIETIHPENLTFAVRGSAVLNDATLEDAKNIGLNKVVHVITNGYNAPSTILSESSPEFLKYYHEADLIISKGQGNFEGLMHEYDPRIFFLLMVKCDVVSEVVGVEKGSFIVYNQAIS